MANTKITTNVIADGAITSAKLDTNITISGDITGTLATAAQPNITSVGTLTGFTSTGIDDNATGTTILIESDRNVGINTTSLSSTSGYGTLSLNGTTGGQLAFQTGETGKHYIYSTSTDLNILNTVAGNITFGTSNTEKMRIDSSGNVGIGTTSPSKVFNVVGSYENTGFYRDYSGAGIGANYVYIGRKDTNGALVEGVRISGGGDDAVAASHTGYFELAINKSGTFIPLLYSSNGTELVVNEGSVDLDFRVESNGNSHMLFVDGGNDRVGIGTSSPSSILHIEGNTNSYTTAPILYFGSTSTINTAIRDWAIGPADDSYGNFHIFRGTSTGANPIGNDGRVFTISSSGNVGIGISNPSDYNSAARNLVVGGSGDTGISIVSGSASNGQLKFADGTGGTAGYRGAVDYNHADDSMTFNVGAIKRFKISSTSAGVTQADGDYLARMYESGADGYLALYTGEASPTEQTRVSSYGQSFINKDTVGQTSTNKTILSVGTDEQSASGTFHVSDGDTANGGIRQSTHSSRVYTNVSSTYTQESANRYWHIKTNIQSPNNIMYIVRVHGYSYGNAGHIIDIQRSGYAYSSHGLHTNTQSANNGSSTSHTLVHYFASDNYLCFRCDSGGGYFTGLNMDIKFQSPTGYNWNYKTIEHQINSNAGSYY